MNATKSNNTGLKSFMMRTEAQGDSFKSVQDMIDLNGKAIHRSWTNKYDGKDYPIMGDPNVDAVSVTKPNPNTIKYMIKKNGSVVDSGQGVISKDGKTSTTIGNSRDANGQPVTYTLVTEKQ